MFRTDFGRRHNILHPQCLALLLLIADSILLCAILFAHGCSQSVTLIMFHLGEHQVQT